MYFVMFFSPFQHLLLFLIRTCTVLFINCKLVLYCLSTVKSVLFYIGQQMNRMSIDTTLCDKVWQWLATRRCFSPGTPVSSSNKADRHNMTEILLKMASNTINQQTNPSNINKTINHFHLKSPNIQMTKNYEGGNPSPVLGRVQKCGGVKLA